MSDTRADVIEECARVADECAKLAERNWGESSALSAKIAASRIRELATMPPNGERS